MIKTNLIKFVKPGIILLGFITFISQVIFLREFLTFFNGNELVIGVILANWMLLMGLGAYLGKFFTNKKKRTFWILVFLSLLAFLPFLTVLGLHVFWYKLYAPGIMAGLIQVFYYSLLVLSPFCILSGLLFTLLSHEESLMKEQNKVSEVYAWEALGSTFGGLLFNFLLVWVLSTFESLYIMAMVVALFVLYKLIQKLQYLGIALLSFLTVGFNLLFFSFDFDKEVRQIAFPGQEIIFANDSPFGVFLISRQNSQVNYYENNVLLSSTENTENREESAHIPMVQHANPKNILVLSGITSGIIHEISKYSIKSIDYVDINPEMLRLARQYLDIDNYKTLKLIEQDAFRYLKKKGKKYDVVLINLPKPSTIQLNRFYTKEFFHLLKSRLTDNAVVSLSVPSSANYLNNETKRFLSILYVTLKSEFSNVLILPAGQDFLLASDNKLSSEIAQKIEDKEIQTEYVNQYYFDDDLLKLRSDDLTKQLDLNVPLNKNFSPVFYQSQIKLWLSRFNVKYWIPAIVIFLFSGFFFMKAGVIYKGVFAAGLAGTSIEIILLLAFQIFFGYVYAVAGMFIMIFMIGLAIGSYYFPRWFVPSNKLFRQLQLTIVLYSFSLPLLFWFARLFQFSDILLMILFTSLIFLLALITGGVFSVASKIIKSDYATIASNAYGLDLLGAATGALLFTIYFIPAFGFIWSVFLSGLLNLIVLFLLPKS